MKVTKTQFNLLNQLQEYRSALSASDLVTSQKGQNAILKISSNSNYLIRLNESALGLQNDSLISLYLTFHDCWLQKEVNDLLIRKADDLKYIILRLVDLYQSIIDRCIQKSKQTTALDYQGMIDKQIRQNKKSRSDYKIKTRTLLFLRKARDLKSILAEYS